MRVDPEDYDDATQEALERCLDALSRSFRGTSVGEFKNAVRTCVEYACMDHCQRRMRREKGIAGSLDETAGIPDEEGDQVGRFERDLAGLAKRIEDGRFEARLDLDRVAAAIEELPNEQMRAVLRRTYEGHSSAEIADELGHTTANVDQLRSRGVRRLGALLAADDDD